MARRPGPVCCAPFSTCKANQSKAGNLYCPPAGGFQILTSMKLTLHNLPPISS
uniref:Uncharacterized protein n=1 Tax=Arundo donax TaxID=35708 RepID=A0A0A9BCY7_ARUDO